MIIDDGAIYSCDATDVIISIVNQHDWSYSNICMTMKTSLAINVILSPDDWTI